MPDQVGSGVAVLDIDNDDRLDLYFVQNAGPGSRHGNRLFRQTDEGRFEDVSEGSGLDVAGRGMGAIAGDVNNDGWVDVVVTEYGATRLFVNQGQGTFREVTREAGIDNPRWSAPAGFFDFDRDGWLDLVVGNYLDYDPTQVCHDAQGRQDFCAPQAFPPTVTRLWRNVTPSAGAVPRFEDRTESSGFARARGVALGLICADFTADGWPDVFVADDGHPNRLYVNRRDGTFSEEAAARGLALNSMGRTAANMGVTYSDVDGDGWGDVFVTHLAEEFHSLFRQDRPGLFADAVAQGGLQDFGWRGTGFGAVMADFDHDGDPDLAMANGLVRRAVPGQTPVLAGVEPWWHRYAQRAQVFVNGGRGRFRDASPENPAFCGQAMVGRSLAMGDFDRDGAPDLVLAGIAGPATLYRNVAPRAGRWVTLRLVDPAVGGRDAIGAEVVVRAGGQARWAVLQPATSYLCSHEPVVHLGLGAVTEVEAIEVRWPDGARETLGPLSVDRRWVIHKGVGVKGGGGVAHQPAGATAGGSGGVADRLAPAVAGARLCWGGGAFSRAPGGGSGIPPGLDAARDCPALSGTLDRGDRGPRAGRRDEAGFCRGACQSGAGLVAAWRPDGGGGGLPGGAALQSGGGGVARLPGGGAGPGGPGGGGAAGGGTGAGVGSAPSQGPGGQGGPVWPVTWCGPAKRGPDDSGPLAGCGVLMGWPGYCRAR